MTDYKNTFSVGQNVRIVGVDQTDPTYGVTGVYAGSASYDGYLGIIILDNPTETHMAVTFPVVCLESN